MRIHRGYRAKIDRVIIGFAYCRLQSILIHQTITHIPTRNNRKYTCVLLYIMLIKSLVRVFWILSLVYIIIMRANQSGLASRRQNFRKQLRKEQLQRQFASHRRKWQEESERNEKEWFYSTYSNITDENYHEHLPFLLHFANNSNYNFMLLPLAGYPFEAFIADPRSEHPLLILEALSQYEQVELPQTEEFVEALLFAMQLRGKAVLSLIANLLEHPRYSSLLRDMLLQAGFLNRAQVTVNCMMEEDRQSPQAQLAVSLFFTCLCQCIKSHPQLVFQVLKEVTHTMSYMLGQQEERYLLFDTLCTIGSTFSQEAPHYAQHLYHTFFQATLREYHNHEFQILQFLLYCVRCGVKLHPKLCNLTSGSLNSHSTIITEKAIILIRTQISSIGEYERKQVYDELKGIGLVAKLRSLMTNKAELQEECLQCLKLIVRHIAVDEDDSIQIGQFVNIIAAVIEHSSPNTLKMALELLLSALQVLQEDQRSLLILLQREGIKLSLQSITRPPKQLSDLIEAIMLLMQD